jgi:hypothetical protein
MLLIYLTMLVLLEYFMKNLINRPLLAVFAVGFMSVVSVNSAVAATELAQTSVINSQAAKLAIPVTVYKDPNCGCCKGWIEHVDGLGFKSTIIHPKNLSGVKDRLAIGANLRSCHTAVTEGGLVFEGHVPAKYIKQFINNPLNNAIGLSVPGMVVGSPGMEVDHKFRPYQIMVLNRDGSTAVYAEIANYRQQF